MSERERVENEPGFVLHGKPWRETSEIIDLITASHGRMSVVVRGMRRPKANLRGILQPFQPLLVSWGGRESSLMTLRAAESTGPAIALRGAALMSAFYVNELVIRFLHKGDAHPQLYASYEATLRRLGGGGAPEVVLRQFELELLAEAGYGLNLDHDAVTGDPLDPLAHYEYVVEKGPIRIDALREAGSSYSGAVLLALAVGDLADPVHVSDARRLLRDVLEHHLAGKPLRTREVFSAMRG